MNYLLIWGQVYAILFPMSNLFEILSAESDSDRFAQMTPEEHAEYQSWLDWVDSRAGAEACPADEADPRDSAGDIIPDDCDGSGAPYGGGGWPGDGSGTDDLADLMATGDRGCCDGFEDFSNPEDY